MAAAAAAQQQQQRQRQRPGDGLVQNVDTCQDDADCPAVKRPPGPRRKDRSKMAAAAVLKYSRSNLGIPLTARLCLPLNGLSRFTQLASTDILVSAYTLATVVVLYSILLSWVEFSLTEGM